MGWWKVQDSNDLVGDDAFDILRRATLDVLALYRAEFDRAPTRSEWEVLLVDALQPIENSMGNEGASLFFETGGPRAIAIDLGKDRSEVADGSPEKRA